MNALAVLNCGAFFQVSSIKYQVSSIKYQVSSIKFQVSSIKYQVSSIKYQVSSIKYQPSTFNFQPLHKSPSNHHLVDMIFAEGIGQVSKGRNGFCKNKICSFTGGDTPAYGFNAHRVSAVNGSRIDRFFG